MGNTKHQNTYHKEATGAALETVRLHADESNIKLYGSCFCPFVQRAWIALIHSNLPYQYIEVDPYAKPPSLTAISPKGLVPALRHGPDFSLHESSVIIEYIEDLAMLSKVADEGSSGSIMALLPTDPKQRAKARLWTDFINRNIIPTFYHLLQAQDANLQVKHAEEMKSHITTLINAAHVTGPFFMGETLGFVDVQFAPWLLRFKRVLSVYRGWPNPEKGSRWESWVNAVESDENVTATVSTDVLYIESYERYAENRPGTSQVADAVNAGRGLP